MVQGASGFVANSLLPQLIKCGFDHFILVDLRPIPKKLLTHLETLGASTEIYAQDNLFDISTNNKPSAVVALAGLTDVDIALQNPKQAFEANIKIAIELGEWLRHQSPRTRLVYLSSDEVLGESDLPLPEDAPLRPTQPYAASKAAAEIVLNDYRDVYKLDVVTLRSCNLIGGHQRARKLIPVAVRYLLLSEPVPIYGNGTHQREWMAVQDLCKAIMLLLNTEIPGGIYQASSGMHLSINEVVEIVAKAIGRSPQRCMVEDRLVHDRSYAMLSTRLRSIGWKPQIDPTTAIANAAREMVTANTIEDFDF